MIFKRQRGGQESAHWYCKVVWNGRQILRCTKCTAKGDAERYERALLKALAAGATQALEAIAESKHREPDPVATVGDMLQAFETAPGQWTSHTKRGYLGSLRTLIETALGATPSWTSRPLSILTSDLVYQYRQAVHRAGAKESDARRTQLGRSGNTVLRSARALVTPALVEYYRREANLVVPDLGEFREAHGFRSVTKEDYRIPSDELLDRTMASLEASRDTHRDRYVAVWLALGFGLRKSEAAAVRAGWFLRIDGRVHLELRGVVEPGKPAQVSDSTKNGEVAPRVPVSNGAWAQLGPFVDALQPDDFVLAPRAHSTFRADDLFDEISEWMRALGWQTQKAFHEFRALAGCRVAQRDGLLVARDWLRHSSVTTTERNYGRYIRTQVTDTPLRDTALDTTSGHIQTIPNDSSLASFGAVSFDGNVIQVHDFRAVQSVTTSEPTPARP